MKLFDTLMSKIFGHSSAPATQAQTSGAPPAATSAPASTSNPPSAPAGMQTSAPAGTQTSPPAPSAAPAASAPAAARPPVDVDAVLKEMAGKNPEHLDWKKSIVDLMKLVGMDSSLGARKQLATELGFTGDQSDSASMNIWLHKQVLKKLAENGGKIPANLLD